MSSLLMILGFAAVSASAFLVFTRHTPSPPVWLIVVSVAAFVGFAVIYAADSVVNPMGWSALLGHVSDGRYYLGSHGAEREVAPRLYWFALAVELTSQALFGCSLGACAVLSRWRDQLRRGRPATGRAKQSGGDDAAGLGA